MLIERVQMCGSRYGYGADVVSEETVESVRSVDSKWD